jgi:hypothetical protein
MAGSVVAITEFKSLWQHGQTAWGYLPAAGITCSGATF